MCKLCLYEGRFVHGKSLLIVPKWAVLMTRVCLRPEAYSRVGCVAYVGITSLLSRP